MSAPGISMTRDWRFKVMTGLLAVQIFFSTLLGAWVHPIPFNQEKLGKDIPSSLRAAGYLTGFKLLVGHLFWIKVIQYYADPDNGKDRFSKLYGYCSLASDLNPNFISIYTYGAAALGFYLNRPLQAARLLQKGIDANPRAVRLKLLYAAIAYRNAGEYDKVIPFLAAQIDRGNGPEMLLNILANTYEEAGHRQKAIALWRKILRTTGDQATRITAAQKLQKLYAEKTSGKKIK
ncbi:MAG: tetratricopeptide repeat protein [bacterium]